MAKRKPVKRKSTKRTKPRRVNTKLAREMLRDFEKLSNKASKKKSTQSRVIIRVRKKNYSTTGHAVRTKILISPHDKKEFKIAKQEFKFKPKFTVRDAQSEANKIRNFIRSRLLPKALGFFNKYGRRSTHRYIVRVDAEHNYPDRKIGIGFSIPRFIARTRRGFTLQIMKLAEEIIGRFEVYLRRKNLSSISLIGFSMEVIL